MSLASLLANKAPPVLVELEVLGAGASASSVVKCRVTDPGGYSRLHIGQTVAVKKVFVPGSQIPREATPQQHIKNTSFASSSSPPPSGGANNQTPPSSDVTTSTSGSRLNTTMDPSSSDRRRCDAIVREVSLLKSLHHPNIVECYGAFAVDQHVLGILTEYCPGNNLRLVYRKDGCPVQEATVQRYTREMLEGLAYLHRRGVVHRDLKGLNVLVSNDGVCKLADFGSAVRIARTKAFDEDGLAVANDEDGDDNDGGKELARRQEDDMDATAFYSMEGTVWWMAPEQFWLGPPGSPKQEGVTGGSYPADIWSLGCLILEMCTGSIPFSFIQGGTFGLMHYLCHDAGVTEENMLPPHVTAAIPAEALRVIRKCLRKDPSLRPTSIELLDDPWISSAAVITPLPLLPSTQADDVTAARAAALATIPLKVHDAARWWWDHFTSTQQSVAVAELCDALQCPSLADDLTPLLAYPGLEIDAVPLAKWAQFVLFFGPFDVLCRDLVLLERDQYRTTGYSPYGCYAGYESTDASHLLLCLLKYPWMQPHATQQSTEEALKHCPPGSFVVRFSSKYSESPGSLTLSVRGDHGVLHYRIARSGDDAWGFAISVPRPRSTTHAARGQAIAGRSSAPMGAGAAAAPQEDTLHFDTIEELVDHFAEVGIRSQRSDKLYRLRYFAPAMPSDGLRTE